MNKYFELTFCDKADCINRKTFYCNNCIRNKTFFRKDNYKPGTYFEYIKIKEK